MSEYALIYLILLMKAIGNIETNTFNIPFACNISDFDNRFLKVKIFTVLCSITFLHY